MPPRPRPNLEHLVDCIKRHDATALHAIYHANQQLGANLLEEAVTNQLCTLNDAYSSSVIYGTACLVNSEDDATAEASAKCLRAIATAAGGAELRVLLLLLLLVCCC